MISDIKEILYALFHFRFREMVNVRLFKMGVVGVIGVTIQFTFFEFVAIQFELLRPAVAAVLGSELAIISNFIWHNTYTFPDRKIPFKGGMVIKFIQFNLAFVVSLGIQWITVSIGEGVAEGNAMILRGFNFLGILIGFLFNYMVYTKFIWRERK